MLKIVKKLLPLVLGAAMIMGVSSTTFADTQNPSVRNGEGEVYESSSSSGGDWRYDIGTSLPADANPVYSRYNLYNTVRKGDVIYESKGGFGVTGHIGIVEGKFYDSGKGVYYIRIIEAIGPGVRRSVIDDVRADDKDMTVYRVSGASSSVINRAVNFCIGEIGSSYYLDFKKDRSSSETDWYCSELVWAAYKNGGIDIETTALFQEPGVTPRDIKNSSKTYSLSYK